MHSHRRKLHEFVHPAPKRTQRYLAKYSVHFSWNSIIVVALLFMATVVSLTGGHLYAALRCEKETRREKEGGRRAPVGKPKQFQRVAVGKFLDRRAR